MNILYRPEDSVAADFIPLYWQGRYHLFYLRDWRDTANHGEGTPWWHLVTEDFVTFEEWGEALPRGPIGSQDVWVFTGCALEHDGLFHIFYTGHNHHLAKIGRPQQCVLHATSPDLKVWTKDPDFAFFAPTEAGYEGDDWRDPFVCWDNEAQEWGMLLAARKTTGPARTRGCTAYATSPDLKSWTVGEPLWAPDQFFTHECPDLFQMGDWWYLVFSEFSDRKQTRYRMSRTPHGPWITPADDALDTRAWYAAKSASDGRRRFFFGWLATRDGEKDDGDYQWGGDLVVHEALQRPDGTLAMRIPDTVAAEFGTPQPLSLTPILGSWQENAAGITTEAGGRNNTAILGKMPEECLIEVDITVDTGAMAAGLLLRAGDDADTHYEVRLEATHQRIVMDRWPRPGDQAFMDERPLAIESGKPIHLSVLVSGTNLVVYADASTALSCRMYDHREGALGLRAQGGAARFEGLTVKQRKSD